MSDEDQAAEAPEREDDTASEAVDAPEDAPAETPEQAEDAPQDPPEQAEDAPAAPPEQAEDAPAEAPEQAEDAPAEPLEDAPPARDDVPVDLPPDEPQPDPWAPVDDVDEVDFVLPATEEGAPEPALKDPWDTVGDVDEPDVELIVAAQEVVEDPWGPIDERPERVEPARPRTALPAAGQIPRGPVSLLPPAPQVLPWRGPASFEGCDWPEVVAVAAPGQARSELDVAWLAVSDETARFRLTADGPELCGPLAQAPSTVEVTLRLAFTECPARLVLLQTDRPGPLRLGRDVLAGRFVVDAGVDASSEVAAGAD